MSSAKWRPFCLGLNELNQKDLGKTEQYQTPTKHNQVRTECEFLNLARCTVHDRNIGTCAGLEQHNK